jgi:channel protein (hemolysin III family)
VKYISFLGFSEPISSITHLLTALIFLFLGKRLLSRGRGNTLRSVSLVLYTFALVYLFTMSGVYHLSTRGTSANHVLCILDHAGIFWLIASSVTPFQIILARGPLRWVPLLLTWAIAVIGIILTSIFYEVMPEWLLLTFFLALSWLSLLTIWNVYKQKREVLNFILLGGFAYTSGALFDFFRWPDIWSAVLGSHEVFHILVVVGAAIHWRAIYSIAGIPISSELTVIIKEYPGNNFMAYPSSEKVNFQGSSIADIQEQVRRWIERSYIDRHKPESIIYRFFKEEIVLLENA